MSTLERAIAIAAEGHGGDTDKGGAPYILHPLRVMMSLETLDQQIVGVLHDVAEDCPGWDLDRFAEVGFSKPVLAALDSVTRRKGEDYDDFLERAAADSIGIRVKLADLRDNADLSRIANPGDEDRARNAKYRRAIDRIKAKPNAP